MRSLSASQCVTCGLRWYPRRVLCNKCLGRDLTDIFLPQVDVLNSFTVVRIGRPGEAVPYGLCIADFDGVPVFARLSGWEGAKIDQEVSVLDFIEDVVERSESDWRVTVEPYLAATEKNGGAG